MKPLWALESHLVARALHRPVHIYTPLAMTMLAINTVVVNDRINKLMSLQLDEC